MVTAEEFLVPTTPNDQAHEGKEVLWSCRRVKVRTG